MTLNEIAYDILNQINGFSVSDDSQVTLRYLYYTIGAYRTRAILEAFEKHGQINPVWYQEFKCVPLDCIDEADCCNEHTDCYIKRATIPNTIYFKNGLIGMQVYLIDRRTSLNYISMNRVEFALSTPLRNRRLWTRVNNELRFYLPKHDILDVVTVRGIFTDPIDVNEDCAECEYDPDTANYPIHEDAIKMYIVPTIVKEIMQALSIGKDDVNNALAEINQGLGVNNGSKK